MKPPNKQRAERDIFNVGEVAGDINVYNWKLSYRPRDEQILLTSVKDEIESRLASSLHNAVFLNLGKEAKPEQVKRPWDREIKIGTQATIAIPDDTTIAQIFDSPGIKGRLLILGQPGAGKTTTLLDLAKSLVKKAEDDANYPIPLLFNLSSWKDERQTIREWMVAELRSKYGVRIKPGQQWVRERVLLPLLDGLDEVAPERQGPCIQAINGFLSEEAAPLYIVVCSRIAEYKNHQIPLQLNGAVYLRELKDSQIRDYLLKVGRRELWNVIASSSELLSFVRAPLLLSIAIIAYSPTMVEEWQQLQTTENQLQYLLDAYVVQILHQQVESRSYGKQKPPNPRQTRYWLRWLATQMDQALQTEFLIEEMQPSMLAVSKRKSYGLLFGLLVGLVGGLLVGLIYGLIIGIFFGLIYGLIIGPIGGLFWGLFFGLSSGINPIIEPVEVLKISKDKLIEQIYGLVYGIMYGLLFGLLFGLIGGLLNGLVGGLIGGLSGGLIFGLIGGLENSSLSIKTLPNQGIRRSAMNWLIFGLIGGLFGGLFGGLVFRVSGGLVFRVSGGLVFGLSGGLAFGLISRLSGGEACIQHLTLRILLYQSKLIPWNYARFLDYCTERLLLQRVGGRYRFVHKLLQDHFARMPQSSLEG